MDEHRGHHWHRHGSPLGLLAKIGGGMALAVALAFIFGLAVLYLWNWLMPDIFGLPRIGYWQAWGLVLLSHILVKPGFGPGSRGHGGMRGMHGRGPWWREGLKDRVAGGEGSKPDGPQA